MKLFGPKRWDIDEMIAMKDIDGLIKAIQDPDLEYSITTASQLTRIDFKIGSDFIPILIAGLKHPAWSVREDVITALGRLGPKAKSAVPALVKVLNDKNEIIRRDAAFALGRIGPKAKAAVPALIEKIDEFGLVREEVIEALKNIGVAALPELIKSLKSKNKIIRRKTAVSIGEIGIVAKDALPALNNALEDEEVNVRKAASIAIKKIEAKIKKVG
jgi:HEAT repeat protein